MIRASIVGSLPKPTWLCEPERLYSPWRLQGEVLAEGQNDAVLAWVKLQEQAGLDIVTDGEQRRKHYIWGFLEGLQGFDTERLGEKASRGRRYTDTTPVARCVSQMAWTGPVMADAVRYLKRNTSRPVKVTLPGPMTTADSVLDEHGRRSDADFAMAYAELLNAEAKACVAAGADIVQFDEPCFNIYIEEVKDWGIAALERAFEGVKAKRAVHICYGYGVEVVKHWKESNQDWSHYFATLPLLAQSCVDQISIETAASGVDLRCLEGAGDKEMMVGVVSVSTNTVETPEIVADRLRRTLRHIPPERLIACTDCGMVPISRQAAVGKMRVLALGAAIVNAEIA